MARLREYTKVNPSVLLLFKTLAIVLFMWHWTACAYWFVAALEHDSLAVDFCEIDPAFATALSGAPNCNKWFDVSLLREPFGGRYAHSFFWAIVATTGVGWDIIPGTALEVTFTTAMIVLGVMMSVTIVGSVTSAISSLNSAQHEKRRKMDQVLTFFIVQPSSSSSSSSSSTYSRLTPYSFPLPLLLYLFLM